MQEIGDAHVHSLKIRSVFLCLLLSFIAPSTVSGKDVYHNVASRDSLIRADILGRIMNALTLHKQSDGKCDLVPLIDIEKFENYYKKITWSLSPLDLQLVQKRYSDAQKTWTTVSGGVPGPDCDDLGFEIADFGIGRANPHGEMLNLLNAVPRESSQYKIYAAAVAWGGYLGASITCPDYSVSSIAVFSIQESDRDEFRIPYLLARMAAIEDPPDCREIETFARDGGVYRPRRK